MGIGDWGLGDWNEPIPSRQSPVAFSSRPPVHLAVDQPETQPDHPDKRADVEQQAGRQRAEEYLAGHRGRYPALQSTFEPIN